MHSELLRKRALPPPSPLHPHAVSAADERLLREHGHAVVSCGGAGYPNLSLFPVDLRLEDVLPVLADVLSVLKNYLKEKTVVQGCVATLLVISVSSCTLFPRS